MWNEKEKYTFLSYFFKFSQRVYTDVKHFRYREINFRIRE